MRPSVLAVAALALAVCGACEKVTPVGRFEIRSEAKGLPDSHPHSSLRYNGRTLTSRLGGYHLDPTNANRLLFTADSEVEGEPCGTFLYDGDSRQLKRLAPWPDGFAGGFMGEVHPWAPDGRRVVLGGFGMPRVIDLSTLEETELAAALSSHGQQLELSPMLFWSPDSRKLAVVVRAASRRLESGRIVEDWDMVEMTLASLTPVYVATITSEFPRWTEDDVRWENGRLVAAAAGRRAAIVRKPPEAVTWAPGAPEALVTKRSSPCPGH